LTEVLLELANDPEDLLGDDERTDGGETRIHGDSGDVCCLLCGGVEAFDEFVGVAEGLLGKRVFVHVFLLWLGSIIIPVISAKLLSYR